MTTDIVVEQLAIGCGDVLHIGHILQAAFNLKRHSSRLNEFAQVFALVHILERQEITLMVKYLAIGIEQVELHAAELGTGSAIGAATKAMLRGIAESAVTDAQRSVDKDFQFCVGHLAMDIGNLA